VRPVAAPTQVKPLTDAPLRIKTRCSIQCQRGSNDRSDHSKRLAFELHWFTPRTSVSEGSDPGARQFNPRTESEPSLTLVLGVNHTDRY